MTFKDYIADDLNEAQKIFRLKKKVGGASYLRVDKVDTKNITFNVSFCIGGKGSGVDSQKNGLTVKQLNDYIA